MTLALDVTIFIRPSRNKVSRRRCWTFGDFIGTSWMEQRLNQTTLTFFPSTSGFQNRAFTNYMLLQAPLESFSSLVKLMFLEPDQTFAVVWVAGITLTDALHRVKTIDHALAACRLGSKYGIRCLVKHEEQLHRVLCPSKPFVACAIKEVYKLEPLPAGTQRQSLVDAIKTLGWKAKPLQPTKGSQGQAWNIGAEGPPPQPFIETQFGWATITKVKEVTPQLKTHDLIATAKTRMHIKEHSSSSGLSTDKSGVDPWLANDPWGNFTPVTKAAQVPSQHVQQKFDDVEARLQESIQAQVSETLQQQDDSRISSVENRIQALVDSQEKLQAWVADGSQKIADIQADNQNIHQCIQQCGVTIQEQGNAIMQVQSEVAQCSQQVISQSQTLQGVAQDLGGLKESWQSTLTSYFEQQADRIEALLAKKQRTSHSWLAHSGLSNDRREVSGHVATITNHSTVLVMPVGSCQTVDFSHFGLFLVWFFFVFSLISFALVRLLFPGQTNLRCLRSLTPFLGVWRMRLTFALVLATHPVSQISIISFVNFLSVGGMLRRLRPLNTSNANFRRCFHTCPINRNATSAVALVHSTVSTRLYSLWSMDRGS